MNTPVQQPAAPQPAEKDRTAGTGEGSQGTGAAGPPAVGVSEAQLRALGAMLVELNQAERLLERVHRRALALGDYDIAQLLDSELFWKLRAAGDHLREHFGLDRVHGVGL